MTDIRSTLSLFQGGQRKKERK